MKKTLYAITLIFGLLFGINSHALAPTIVNVTTTNPATYDDGDTIIFSVQFDQVVTLAGGAPSLKFRAPSNLTKNADYNMAGSGTDTLQFAYNVTSAENLNDWDGIELEDSSGNPASLVMNGATIQNATLENANTDVPVTNFAGIKIDSKNPTWDSIEISTTAGMVNSTTRYLPDNSSVTTVSTLTENDTRLSASVDLSVGGGAAQTITYTGSNVNGQDKDAQKSGTLTGNGAITLAGQSWVDQAAKSATGVPTFTINDTNAAVTSYVLDSIAPVISFGDDIAVGPVVSEDIVINVTDINGDTTTYQYGFSADAVCDASDTFGLPFTAGATIMINDESSNGMFICAKALDFAGNESYQISAAAINIDATAPKFDNIGVVSNNAYDTSYGKADSILTFTLTLDAADSYDGNGTITFEIDGNAQTIPLIEAASTTASVVYTATFDLSTFGALVNAATVSVTAIDFADSLGQNITDFVVGAPTPTVIIDTEAPSLDSASASTSGVTGTWATAGETATFLLGFSEEIIRGTLNSATTANNISTLTTDIDITVFGLSDAIIFTAANGDNGIVTINNADFTIIDRAGNITAISAGDINTLVTQVITTDTTLPTISNVSIFSDNALDTTLAKTNDTITVQFDTADNLSPTVTVNSAQILNSSATDNATGAVGAAKNIARFTDGTETSEVIVPFAITIIDEAGNISNITTTTNNASQVQFDRTDPIVQAVEISATSVDNTAFLGDAPAYYAKQGDTLDFELQVCDYVDSQNNPPTGTLFGQAVTLTDGGQTGVACVTPEGNPSIWRKWTTQLTNIDGTEGLVVIDINVKDNAGNVLVSVTGATNGSSVIFDKTIPINPTDVTDTLGAETLTFKYRANAQFGWTNDVDDMTNSMTVSGIQNYNVRLTNPANGGEQHRAERRNSRNFDGRISQLAPWAGLPIPPRDITDPYDMHIQTRDKAGNDSLEIVAYTQPYTIAFVGRVVDTSGNPISGVVVQVVARYGQTCDLNREVCTGITDANGEYLVLAQKDQDYNITFFHNLYYLDKHDENIGNAVDFVLNSTLQGLASAHDVQTANQGIEITTNEQFIGVDGQNTATKILVYSWSGEISTDTSVSGQITVTSLSTINLVSSNNPAVSITNNGNNTYTIRGAGTILTTSSLTGQSERNADGSVTDFGKSSQYGSGQARIGVVYNSGNGKGGNKFGKYTTPAEWEAYRERMRVGVAPQIITYINDNGHEVFAGYRYGILGTDRYKKRFQNEVKFRGISRNRDIALDVAEAQEKIQTVIPLSVTVENMKATYQDPEMVDVDHEAEFLKSLETFKPLPRVTKETAYKGVLNRNAQKNKVNKFERRSGFDRRIVRNPHNRNMKVIRINFGNGTSARIERMMR